MRVISLLLTLGLAKSTSAREALAEDQLQDFKNSTKGPVGILTTTFGAPVESKYADNSIDDEEDLMFNMHLMEGITNLPRENIPQRIVHGKGTGASGYFIVTHDVTDISNVAAFSKVGKVTPVAVRFSCGLCDKGLPDTRRGAFAIGAKFYTEEGNWDFLGFNTDTFFLKDPIRFLSAVHSLFKSPKTGLVDTNAFLDFFFQQPESLDFFLQFFSDLGIPKSYRHLQSHAFHTFQVENYKGEVSFVRIVMETNQGEKFWTTEEGTTLAGTDPDYYTEDLYNAIACGDYPSWTVGWQVISEKDLKKVDFDIFDITVRWSKKQFPVRPIGKMVLNKNPENFFADVEQMALNPANLPPGIRGSDKVFLARSLAYREANMHRLGSNFHNIKINCPLTKVLTYLRNGAAPVGDNFGGIPSFYPNTFNGPVPTNFTRDTRKRVIKRIANGPTNFKQAGEYYRGLSEDARDRMLKNLITAMSLTYESTQKRGIELFSQIDCELGSYIEQGLADIAAGRPNNGKCPKNEKQTQKLMTIDFE